MELICGKRPAFYQVDVTDEAALDSVFEKHPAIDSVIHFAALKVSPGTPLSCNLPSRIDHPGSRPSANPARSPSSTTALTSAAPSPSSAP